jgi:hypothetical protein
VLSEEAEKTGCDIDLLTVILGRWRRIEITG